MVDQTKDRVDCRYLMYTDSTKTKAWRLDVSNNGECPRFSVNGNEIIASKELEAEVLIALAKLDTAFGNLMIHQMKLV